MVLKLSKTSRTGLVPGLLRVKECTMEPNQCKNQAKIPLIQPLLILAHHNFLFHLMFLRISEQNGTRLFLNLIVLQIRLSVMYLKAVTKLAKNLSP